MGLDRKVKGPGALGKAMISAWWMEVLKISHRISAIRMRDQNKCKQETPQANEIPTLI